MEDIGQNFNIKGYAQKSTFSSFLPGISGIHGIPIWCYYVNRGQCVTCFGVDNKDHAIMEFYPAHVAYQNVKRTGFRTFIRVNGKYAECFSDEDIPHEMSIAKNSLKIAEDNQATGIRTRITYFILPEEKLGALVRKVEIENTDDEDKMVEVLDGMPAVIPYGVGMDSMKNMTQTAKAWMQVEDVDRNLPYFRVRASMEDTASVSSIEGGNFSAAFEADGSMLHPVVDPELVFSYDNSLEHPVTFEENGLQFILDAKQNTKNQIPCSFYGTKKSLGKNGTITIYEMIGQVEGKDILDEYMSKTIDEEYFRQKEVRAKELTEELCRVIETRTASKEFDEYCRYTYMDNVLRGGMPMKLGRDKIFYAYSRKHGDLERDYNYFSMLPEFYSQGNGNYRDVNQNRRCDTFFAPFVGRENIKEFYSLIQLDGYNPLGVEKLTYTVGKAQAAELTEDSVLAEFISKPFTPGALWKKLDKIKSGVDIQKLFDEILDKADSTVNGNFGEGYWCDHWTYNLDLIEDYLEIYPEEEKDMLYEEAYTYFQSQVNVNNRQKRYEKTPDGIRQYHALDESSKRNTKEKLVRTEFGEGDIYRVSLMEKLLLLCAVKFATLDAYGMGIEMEGGKPGWYDALNGMPGMLGSSMAETYELSRMLKYTMAALEKYPREVALTKEVRVFIEELGVIAKKNHDVCKADAAVMTFWNQINDAKEIYRDDVYEGISGKKEFIKSGELLCILKDFQQIVNHGIEKAYKLENDICPTYFTYDVLEYVENEKGIQPLKVQVNMVPFFLEGPVRYLKLDVGREKKKQLYDKVKNSDLYDEKLKMYKVNASLENASYELGRARAFTPGWLENESIWLHMEYKYLLELLKSGLYEEFFEDFHKAAIPFLDADTYGRSIYENSSFIASSKNPNSKIHGKGFVARLSGSTIEFISMWKQMMFGRNIFRFEDNELIFNPAPAIPKYLIAEDYSITATMLGDTLVTYRVGSLKNYIPGEYEIKDITLIYKNGSNAEIISGKVTGQLAEDIRDGKVKEITINIQ